MPTPEPARPPTYSLVELMRPVTCTLSMRDELLPAMMPVYLAAAVMLALVTRRSLRPPPAAMQPNRPV